MNVEAESWVRPLVILSGATLLGLLLASVALAGPADRSLGADGRQASRSVGIR